MIRRILSLAIVLCVTPFAPAEEPAVAPVSAAPATSFSAQLRDDQPDAPSEPTPTDRSSVDNGSVRFVTIGGDSVDPSAHGYYPVHDPCCDPLRLDRVCPDHCGPDCSTDEWFDHPCLPPPGARRRLDDGTWVANDPFLDVSGPPPSYADSALRFGYWNVQSSGSTAMTGEFQKLSSSPFFDFDTLMSDGNKTLDLILSGLDNEANDARARFYSPWLNANVRYQRYLRQFGHDPMAAPGPPYPPNNPPSPGSQDFSDVVSDDLNIGEDYAIRVQQLDAKFKGPITSNIDWKMNVWGMRKFGERQMNATAHCFNVQANTLPADNRCHILSQRQQIDWTTLDLMPAVEARFEGFTVEYSHTIRTFSQNDQLTDRNYTRFSYQQAPATSAQNGLLGPDFLVGVVPESVTHIDRVKLQVDLNEHNQFYANGYNGETKNEFRETHRELRGFDVRLTNRYFERTNLTAYSSMYDESNQLPPTFFNSAPLGIGETAANVDHPVDYNRTRYGLKGDWRPFDPVASTPGNFDRLGSLRLVSGYEYYIISRDYATYTSNRLGTFTQPATNTHQFEFGPKWNTTDDLNHYLRYRARFTEDPIVGIRESQGRFNTNQPETEHRVDFSTTWMPADNFMATAQLGFVNRWNNSFYPSAAPGNRPIDFTEQDYPLVLTLWHQPTERLSFTASYAYSANFVDQDITVGFRGPDQPGSPFETVPWSYQGTNQLANVSATYRWTETLNLLGGVEWDNGNNAFDVPPMTDTVLPAPPGGLPNWALLPTYSAVRVTTVRITGGLDWHPYDHITLYTRYVYFDYDDKSQGTYTGTANMLLGGVTAVW